MKKLTMDDILNCDLGLDTTEDIRVIFQKKTAVKQYEPELIEVQIELRDNKNMSGPDRMLTAATLLAQAEYTCFVQLLAKNHVSEQEFSKRKEDLTDAINSLTQKYTLLTGKEPTHIFKQ